MRSTIENTEGEDGPTVTNVYCTGRYNEGKAMIDQIEIPESFPSPGAVSGKRVVITGASRGLGALLAHAFSQPALRGARRPHREGPEGGRRGPSRTVPRAQW